MYITVLCKVVDNFGDIGVVWRLCNQLSKIQNQYEINLVVDDLVSFSKINNQVQTDQSFQIINSINIYSWNSFEFCHNYFIQNDGEKLSVILECFQCGRPDWMEKILFEEKLERTVNIIMIDYLTAEKYAEDFHCLNSLTRSAKVKKVNFMPGFTEKTGGLIIDEEWKNPEKRNSDGNILVFTYERDWNPLTKALEKYLSSKNCKKVLVAQGRGKQSFIDSCSQSLLLKTEVLPYLNQNEWDKMMKNCSVLIIRGEESMSRACLSGIPFIWHAYPQSDEYQMVKVNALLERMKEYFSEDDFCIIQKVWTYFNKNLESSEYSEMENACELFFKKADLLACGFEKFANDLRKNDDLAANLMTFIYKIDIIK